ncbi:MAG: phage tail protein [Lachnospiraceae bacterium]|nr:phage tail protein [Lachnospiraceae bacterium]
MAFLKGIDSLQDGGSWGRLFFDVEKSESVMYSVYILASDQGYADVRGIFQPYNDVISDPGRDTAEKLSIFKEMGARRYVGVNDILLYELEGRYLFIVIEAVGEGDLTIRNLKVDSTGDNFMAAFPEIYQERDSFFHRYISIFSSIYNDFQADIEALPDMLNLETCSKELLVLYAGWMGVNLQNVNLDEKILRNLVKEIYSLNRMKGTKKVVKRIIQILINEDAVIIEHNSVRSWLKKENAEIPPNFKVRGLYDVTILIKKRLTEELSHQMMYILEQFLPIRTKLHIAQMDEVATVDSNSFLDVNVNLAEEKEAILDEDSALDGRVILS